VPERKECTYSYFADPMYVFMDTEYNQYEVEGENMVDAVNYLEDGMPVEVVFYDGKAISVEMPNSVVREVIYTEPAVKGDTSGKVMKPPRSAPAWNSPCRCSSRSATRSKSTRAPASTRTALSKRDCEALETEGSFGCPLHLRRQRPLRQPSPSSGCR
jgi:hypothetical protein